MAGWSSVGGKRFSRQAITATATSATALGSAFFGEPPPTGPGRTVAKPAGDLAVAKTGQYAGMVGFWAFSNSLQSGAERNLAQANGSITGLLNFSNSTNVTRGSDEYGAYLDTFNNDIGRQGATTNRTLAQMGIASGQAFTIFLRLMPPQFNEGTDRSVFALNGVMTFNVYGTIYEAYNGSYPSFGERPETVVQTLVMTYDPVTDQMTVYKNGVLGGTQTVDIGDPSASTLSIGYDFEQNFHSFRERIYEAGLVLGAWTPPQAAQYDVDPLGMLVASSKTAIGAALDARWNDRGTLSSPFLPAWHVRGMQSAPLTLSWDDLESVGGTPTLPTAGTATTQYRAGSYPYDHQFSHDATGASALIVAATTAAAYAFDPAATFNGAAMTLLARIQHAGGNGTVWMFGLNAPAQTTGTVRVFDLNNYVDIGVTTALNVSGSHPTTPFSATGSATGATSVELTITTTHANSLVVAAGHNHYTSGGSLTVSGDTNTELWNNATSADHRQVGVGAAEALPGAHSLIFNAPFNGINVAAVEVRGAPGAGGGKTTIALALAAQWHDRAALFASLNAAWHDRTTAAQTSDLRWHDRNRAAQAVDLRWHDRTTAAQTSTLPWHIRGKVAQPSTLPWHDRAAMPAPSTLPWHIRGKVAQPSSFLWNDKAALAGLADLRWNDKAAIPAPSTVPWHIRGKVAQPSDLRWNIRGNVAQPSTLPWHVRSRISGPADLRWNVRGLLGSPLQTPWHIRGLLAAPASLVWNDRALATSLFATPWDVLQTVGTLGVVLSLRWHDRAQLAAPVSAPWHVRGKISVASQAMWHDRVSLASLQQLGWHDRARLDQGLDLNWHDRAKAASLADLRWNDRALLAASSDSRWHVRGLLARPVSLDWAVRGRSGSDTDLRWATRELIAAGMGLPWDILQTIGVLGTVLNLRWDVKGKASSQAAYPWHIRSGLVVSSTYPWAVRASAGQSSALPWSVRQNVRETTSLNWHDRQAAPAPVDLPWDVRGRLAVPAELDWRINALAASSFDAAWALRQLVGESVETSWDLRQAAAADADLRWNLLQSLGTSIGFVWDGFEGALITPDNRILFLPAEPRGLLVPADSRLLDLPAEVRAVLVAADARVVQLVDGTRVALLPAERRAIILD